MVVMNTRIYCEDRYMELRVSPGASAFPPEKMEALARHASFRIGTERKPFVQDIPDLEPFLKALAVQYQLIEAAGGFIKGRNGWLFIRRHGRWDLPKGKLEKRENPKDGAIRECEEECGVEGLEIVGSLPDTYHIYPYKGGQALKRTHWFAMRTEYDGPLKPQTSESIEAAVWLGRDEIQSKVLSDTYYTIQDLLNNALGFSTV
jgi:8-oxo-dGTP pyrophosphatase MutT (NUDIX family)